MVLPSPSYTHTDPLFPYTTLFRSRAGRTAVALLRRCYAWNDRGEELRCPGEATERSRLAGHARSTVRGAGKGLSRTHGARTGIVGPAAASPSGHRDASGTSPAAARLRARCRSTPTRSTSSEERRDGNACVSRVSSRWSPHT